MPRYDYRCAGGHTIERTFPIGAAPSEVTCAAHPDCPAHRVYSPPAAIHFRGGGFYSTDVKGRVGRRRRKNAGDDLHREFDHSVARIADRI